MANKVFQSFKVNQSHPRNGFDTSYRNMFTLPTGALIPFFVKDVNPGDHLKLSATCETRSVQMSSYNFQRCRQHFDYYFVPYRLLWRWWPQFIASTTDYGSSILGSSVFDSTTGTYTVSYPVSGYYCPYFLTSSLSVVLQDGELSDSGSLVERTDSMGYSIIEGFKRIAYALGLDARSFMHNSVGAVDDHAIVPFRFLAYQKIFYDFYRNTDYEVDNPFAYNLDYMKPSATLSSMQITTSHINPNMFMLRYALYNRDQVTYIKPTQASSFIGQLSNSTVNSIAYNGLAPINRQQVISSTGQGSYINTEVGVNSTTGETSVDGTYVFTASDNRLNSALDKISRIQMMAEKRYSSQIEAHFGERVDPRDDNRCRRIGSSFINIGTQEVTSTADSGEAGLGSIGAKGYGKDTIKPVTFDADEHGVVIGITYIEPLIDYLQNFEDPFYSKLTRTAYFTPELDGLGLQPVYSRNVQTFTYDAENGSFATTTLGYQPRYMEYKSSRDVVSPAFKDAYPTWVSPREHVFDNTDSVVVNSGTWFHISPALLDDIFFSAYNGKPETDQFQCCVNNNVLYVTNMSVTGLPRL